jgi:hypothetical protein
MAEQLNPKFKMWMNKMYLIFVSILLSNMSAWDYAKFFFNTLNIKFNS